MMRKLRVIKEVEERVILGTRFKLDDCLMILENAITCSYVDDETLKAVSIYIDLTRFTLSEKTLAIDKLNKYCEVDTIL